MNRAFMPDLFPKSKWLIWLPILKKARIPPGLEEVSIPCYLQNRSIAWLFY